MRKKICGRCGKFIDQDTQCSCKQTTMPNNNKKIRHEKNELHTQRWRKKRLQIIQRDNGMCMRCFIKYNYINTEDLTVHHILSRAKHPELMYEDENLICLCSTCNKQLGTKDKLDFEWDPKKIQTMELKL